MDDFDCVAASYTDQIADCFVPGEDDEDVIEERFCRVSDNWNRYIDFFSDVQEVIKVVEE